MRKLASQCAVGTLLRFDPGLFDEARPSFALGADVLRRAFHGASTFKVNPAHRGKIFVEPRCLHDAGHRAVDALCQGSGDAGGSGQNDE